MPSPAQVARTTRRTVGRTLGLGALAGAGLTAYAAWEARQYTLRRVTVPVLPAGHAPLRVLHLSDIHMAPGQRAKQEWLRGLADLGPDLVVNTGDNLSHMRSVPVVADALGGLLDVPGVYVLGSNDYYAPGLRNPLRYLLPDTGKRNTSTPQLPWPELKDRFGAAGWVDLTNGFGSLTVGGTSIAFAGVDDPHLKYDDLERVAGPADPATDIRLGVTHAPYLRVLDQFARDGYEAIIAGHTHGGQVCLPGFGALVANCDIPLKQAKGLSTWSHSGRTVPLNVSAGCGHSIYAPVRFACRPEATLLTLTARS